MKSIKTNLISKIEDLTQELIKVGDEIEIDREENYEDDSSIRQDLLDKKDMLEQQIDDLRDSLKMIENEKDEFGQQYNIEINGLQRSLTIVHRTEADPVSGRISNDSPLAKALLGKSKGQEVIVETPAGKQVYKLV